MVKHYAKRVGVNIEGFGAHLRNKIASSVISMSFRNSEHLSKEFFDLLRSRIDGSSPTAAPEIVR
jgi:hypothetical protein